MKHYSSYIYRYCPYTTGRRMCAFPSRVSGNLFRFPYRVLWSLAIPLLVVSFSAFATVGVGEDSTEPYLDSASGELVYERTGEEQKVVKEKSRFALSTGFQQVNGFIISADHVTRFFFTGAYRINNDWSFSVVQNMDRHYFLNPQSKDQGLWLKDTILSTTKKFRLYKSLLNVRVSSTLPLSYYSQTNDILTVSTLDLIYIVKPARLLNINAQWAKGITMFINPVVRHYLGFYTTSRTYQQSVGGTPLPEFLLGLKSIGLSVSIIKDLSINAVYGRWVIFPYRTSYGRDQHSQYDNFYQRHYYLLSLSANWQITKQWEVSLAYSHIDRLDRQGRLEMVLFDDRVSEWALSTSYSFAFNSL